MFIYNWIVFISTLICTFNSITHLFTQCKALHNKYKYSTI